MCGIAGIMFKGAGVRDTGKALIDMLDGCQHRGPDSTGFALRSRPTWALIVESSSGPV